MNSTPRIILIQQANPSASASAIEAQAKAIAATIKRKGHCSPFDLIWKQFRPMEVFKNWNIAYSLGLMSLSHEQTDTRGQNG